MTQGGDDQYLGMLSPDGQYRWNGQDWERVQQSPVGPLSPDGRYQWNGSQWVPLPAPPRKHFDFGSGEVAKVALLCFIAFALFVVIYTTR